MSQFPIGQTPRRLPPPPPGEFESHGFSPPPSRFDRPSPLPPPPYDRGVRQGTAASSPPHPGIPAAVNQTLQNIGRHLVGGQPPSSNFDYVSPFTPEQEEQRLLADVQGNMQYALPPGGQPHGLPRVSSPYPHTQSSTIMNTLQQPQHRLTTQESQLQNEYRRQNERMLQGLPPGGPPPLGPPPTRYTPRR